MHDIYDALLRHASKCPSRTAFSDDLKQVSYSEVLTRVAALVGRLGPRRRAIGILASNGVSWALAQLAGIVAGKIVVPLPIFFSAAQLGHIVNDAGVEMILITEETSALAAGIGLPTLVITNEHADTLGSVAEGFAQIIYTSGSTGQPKGVLHARGQLGWSANALAKATQANESDLFLSVLPLPLLLETLCAIFVPMLAGAGTHFDVATATAVGQGRQPTSLANAFATSKATTTVLVPQLLRGWVAELKALGRREPGSLRFVAVGGAPVPGALANEARALGIPVFEGYGLSECCSVVAVNTEGARKPGGVGKPLPGLVVAIDGGEVVVDGPSVMDGYLHRPPAERPWRTGDLGAMDEDGFLTVYGRKDNLIVTSFGRNISPEWIETMLLEDARISSCLVCGHGEPHLRALIVPSPSGAAWFEHATGDEVSAFIAHCCRSAPAYAVPQDYGVVPLGVAQKLNLMAPDGALRRKKAIEHFSADGRDLGGLGAQR